MKERVMKGLKITVLALCLMVVASAAQAGMTMNMNGGWMINVGGEQVSLPGQMEATPNSNGDITWDLGGNSIVTGDYEITYCDFTFNADPLLDFGFSVKNTSGATQTYNFVFMVDLVPPIGDLNSIFTSLQAGITDSSLDREVTVGNADPMMPPAIAEDASLTEMMVVSLSNDGGTTFFNVGSDLGDVFRVYDDTDLGFAGDSISIFGGGEGPVTRATEGGMPWNKMQINIDFTLSDGDRLTASGAAVINAVPLPAASIMMISGIIALVGLRKRD